MKSPILVYPDPNKPFTLFTEASKYACSAVFTQEYTTFIDDKAVSHQSPITFISELFQVS